MAEYAMVYWDASAVLSVLFRDVHSPTAREWAAMEGVHFLSSLAWSEVCAVIFRMEKERIIGEHLVNAAREALRRGPWRRLSGVPDWEITENLSRSWMLRGADLWHLALVKRLLEELPDLMLLTFDVKLEQAAKGEGLSAE